MLSVEANNFKYIEKIINGLSQRTSWYRFISRNMESDKNTFTIEFVTLLLSEKPTKKE